MKNKSKIRILIACDHNVTPYVTELYYGLKQQDISVDIGLDKFWIHSEDYDIIHLQWPEALFRWKNPSLSDLRVLFSTVLPEWRKTAKIVITRHNRQAHSADIRPNFKILYKYIYQYVDGVVHLGDYGIEEFKKINRNIKFHALIPPMIESCYGEEVNKSLARQKLNISMNKTVILAFGAIRNTQERMLLLHAFQKLNIAGKFLIAPNFGPPIRPSRRNILKWLRWELKNREIFWPRKLYLGQQFVPSDMVKYYFSAADAVVIPRINTINSGLVYLAFQFGKTVAGPNIGNIGLILKSTGNPVFNPSSKDDCASCIEKAVNLASKRKGIENKKYAYDNWMLENIIAMHKKFFKTVAFEI